MTRGSSLAPAAAPDQPVATNAPSRVALCTGNYHLVADGVSLTLNRLVAFLMRQGIEVLVFGPDAGDRWIPYIGTYVPVRSVAAPRRSEYRVSLGFPRAARRRFLEFRPDLVHCATPDLLGLRAAAMARRLAIPVVASYHTHFPSYLRHYRLGRLEGLLWEYLRRFYRQCEHVYVASPSIADALEANGVRRGVHLWERGVDVQHFHPRRRSVEWRREQGIGDDEAVVLFVGRTVREKGLSILADVDRRLTARRVPYRLVVVGDGPDREALEVQAPSAQFLGFLRGDALARAYASADVFLFPSETETLGNVTLEAMASGLPTVCADAPGSDHLVIDGVTGFLVEPRNSEAFAERVVTLIADRALRKEMGKHARQRARASDWGAALERLLHLYRHAVQGGSSSGQSAGAASTR